MKNIMFKRPVWGIVAVLMIPVYLSASMFFIDVPKNHWAYDAVRELAERGLIEGYDGKISNQFKGDRTLTRYEFAQALMKMVLKWEADPNTKVVQ